MNAKASIYLDYQATTPVDPRVLEIMLPYFTEKFGNPSSMSHAYGWVAQSAVDQARIQIAKLLSCTSQEVFFTSGGSEGNNWALQKISEKYSSKGKHIITTQIEHACVLYTCRELEKKGFKLTYLPVDASGFVKVSDFQSAVTSETILASIMCSNNEVGTFQPIEEIGKICKREGIVFHTDAVQSAGRQDLNVDRLGVDLLSLSAHKIYGPKGVGVLYVRRKNPYVELEPLIFGGGQERGLRAGTLNVPGIVGMGKAVDLLIQESGEECRRLEVFKEKLLKGLKEVCPSLEVNGDLKNRLCHNLNLYFPGCGSELLMSQLKSVAVSAGSACSSGNNAGSHVLRAMGFSPERVKSSIRVSLGRMTTEAEIDEVIERFKNALKGV